VTAAPSYYLEDEVNIPNYANAIVDGRHRRRDGPLMRCAGDGRMRRRQLVRSPLYGPVLETHPR
jgi:hypothetical protein